jgi:hypothetical protein
MRKLFAALVAAVSMLALAATPAGAVTATS